MTLRLGGISGSRAIGLGVAGLPDASKWPMSVTMAPPTGASVPTSTTRPRSTFVPLGMGGAGAWACTSVVPSAATRSARSAVRVIACASTLHGKVSLRGFIMPYDGGTGGVSHEGGADQPDLSISEVTSRVVSCHDLPTEAASVASVGEGWSSLNPFLERSPQCAGEPFSPSSDFGRASSCAVAASQCRGRVRGPHAHDGAGPGRP